MAFSQAFAQQEERLAQFGSQEGTRRCYGVCVHCRVFTTLDQAIVGILAFSYPEATVYVVEAVASEDVGQLVMEVFRERKSLASVHYVGVVGDRPRS